MYLNRYAVFFFIAQISFFASGMNPESMAVTLLNHPDFSPRFRVKLQRDEVQFGSKSLLQRIQERVRKSTTGQITSRLVSENPKRYLINIFVHNKECGVNFGFSTSEEWVHREAEKFDPPAVLKYDVAIYENLLEGGPVSAVLSRLAELNLRYLVEYRVCPAFRFRRDQNETRGTMAYLKDTPREFVKYALKDVEARLKFGEARFHTEMVHRIEEVRASLDKIESESIRVAQAPESDLSALRDLVSKPERDLEGVRLQAQALIYLKNLKTKIEKALQN